MGCCSSDESKPKNAKSTSEPLIMKSSASNQGDKQQTLITPVLVTSSPSPLSATAKPKQLPKEIEHTKPKIFDIEGEDDPPPSSSLLNAPNNANKNNEINSADAGCDDNPFSPSAALVVAQNNDTDEGENPTKKSSQISQRRASTSASNARTPFNVRHGEVTREETFSNFHIAALSEASPKTLHRMFSTFRVFIATWNVGNAEPSSMRALFEHINVHGKGADIIFVAAQECSYTPTDVKINVRDHWNQMIDAILPDYAVVAHRGLWEMRTMLLVKNAIRDQVTDIMVSREATGIGSVAGNKGGISLGCTVMETRILFVGSHLAAHLEEVEKRNQDFYEIIEGFNQEYSFNGIEPLNYFHHVFWCGDLNYRIEDLSREDVITAIENRDLQKLLSHDQLIRQMAAGKVFTGGFREADVPTFNPTYRFLRNTDPSKPRVYDDFKGRIPSWCDRILHKSLGSSLDQAYCLEYNAEHDVRSSDHSPVFASFDVNSRQVARNNLEQRERAWRKQQNVKQLVGNEEEDDEFSELPDHHVLTITNISGHDLLDADVGIDNHSDCYIIFRIVENKHNIAKTPVIPNDLNPNWKDEKFQLDLGTRVEIGMLYLHCVLMDEDVVKDDPLGQAVYPLELVWEAKEKENKSVTLNAPVYHDGKRYGSLKLTLSISKV